MKNITLTLAILCFALTASTSFADNFRTLQFGENSRTLTFPNNARTLSFDGPAISYPPAQYSLDSLANHPYNSAGAVGHASQSPGSAKWFRPGFGYRSPTSKFRTQRYQALNPYNSEYAFGIRNSNLRRNDRSHLYHTNAYGGPWYFPRSTTNTQPRVFSW